MEGVVKRLAALVAVLAFSGCQRVSAPVRIGSKNFSEQVLLAEIVAQALEGKGLSEDRRRWGAKTISDLKAHEAEIRPGFGYEFLERGDGFPGLAKTYGLNFSRRPAQMDLGLLYPALQSHQVDLIAGNSTDGLIAALGAVVLQDDRHYFPPYEAAFVVRGKVWRENAAAREVLERLGRKISAETMRRLNAQLDRDKRRPEDVAKEFLASFTSK